MKQKEGLIRNISIRDKKEKLRNGSTAWMLRQIWKYPSKGISQLRSFVHPNHYKEIDEELIVAINELEQEDAFWYLRQMKNPNWVKTIGHREVNVIVMATTIDTHEQIEIQPLVNSGCMTSAISN